MIVRLAILAFRLSRAAARDARNAVKHSVLGPTCRVTGDRVYPKDRVSHEHTQHPTDGPCVLL